MKLHIIRYFRKKLSISPLFNKFEILSLTDNFISKIYLIFAIQNELLI